MTKHISFMLKCPAAMHRALAVVVFALAMPCQAMAGDLEDSISRASRYVSARDYSRAIQEYENALKISPGNAKTYLLMGLVYANMNDLNNAIKFTEKALELDPSYSAYNNLALVYANKGDFEKALSNYDKASSINPSAHTPWYHKGLIYSSKKEYQLASENYKKSAELNRFFAEAYVGLGSALYYLGDKAGAWEQVKTLKELKFKTQSEGLQEWLQNKEKASENSTTEPSSKPSASSAPN